MKIRIVDYVASLGGGVRFSTELVRALGDRRDLSFEVVSHGTQLERYRTLLTKEGEIHFADIPPENAWKTRTLLAGIPGAGPLNWLLGTPVFHFSVPPRVLDDCDLVWLPWMQRHRIPWHRSAKVVASLHDLIVIEWSRLFPPKWGPDERETVSSWLASDARIAVSSNATASTLHQKFGMACGRVAVIPLSGQHGRQEGAGNSREWPFSGKEYILCPANTSLHKNHDVLLKGVGDVAPSHPVVLTGEGTDFFANESPRSLELRRIAMGASLVRDRTIFAMGYVGDDDYYRILDGAWALVMPTLAEGGGSFPVWEAMHVGIPVVCSNIPVMKEMVERANGQVIWFDPREPSSLAAALADLDRNYPRHKAAAVAQIPQLHARTWEDVGRDYARLMQLAGPATGSAG